MVISRIDYCNALLTGLPACAVKPLQMVQNAATRLVFDQPKRAHVTPLFIELHWLPLAARIRFKSLINSWKPSSSESISYPSTDLVLPYPLYACTLSLLCHLWQSLTTGFLLCSLLLPFIACYIFICKSLWIKASAKYRNRNIFTVTQVKRGLVDLFLALNDPVVWALWLGRWLPKYSNLIYFFFPSLSSQTSRTSTCHLRTYWLAAWTMRKAGVSITVTGITETQSCSSKSACCWSLKRKRTLWSSPASSAPFSGSARAETLCWQTQPRESYRLNRASWPQLLHSVKQLRSTSSSLEASIWWEVFSNIWIQHPPSRRDHVNWFSSGLWINWCVDALLV